MKIKKLTRHTALFAVVAVVLSTMWSCQTEENVSMNDQNSNNSLESRGAKIVLGEKLNNPFDLRIMQEAIQNLNSNGRITEDISIRPTHTYIRFLPADSSELDLLRADSILLLYDHPLDFDIAIQGNWYHDPEIPDDEITWQYTVIPYQYNVPNVSHELLYDLFMPEIDSVSTTGRMDANYYLELEREAFKIAGLEEDLIEDGSDRRVARSKYRPQGTLQVQERFLNNRGVMVVDTVPLIGAKVKARYLTKIRSVHTNTDGFFRMGDDFKYDVNFNIEFETDGYVLTNFFSWSLNYNRSGRHEVWNWVIPYSEYETWVNATLMNSVFHFRSHCQEHQIWVNNNNDKRIKIRVKYENGRSNTTRLVRHYWGLDWLGNDVALYSQNVNGKLQTDQLHALTCHELAHTSHFHTCLFWPLSRGGIVMESYAQAVEYYFTIPHYTNRIVNNPSRRNDFEALNDLDRNEIIGDGGDSWKYTPFFIDLIDNTNQFTDVRFGRGVDTLYANDNVTGYTLSQFQEAMHLNNTSQLVLQYLADHYNNPTEIHLNDLYRYCDSIEDENR